MIRQSGTQVSCTVLFFFLVIYSPYTSHNITTFITQLFHAYQDGHAEKDEMKRFTETDPPFWISLHHPSFDKMRWVSIKQTGEYYEKGVTSMFHQILSTYDLTNTKEKQQPPPLVIDIGMNIGWFSLYSRAHGHDVAAFEPNPVMFLRMCESLEYNKWGSANDDSGNSVSLWKYGLGVQKGSFNLTLGNNPGGSSFFEDRLAKKFRRTIPVEVTTLDTVAVTQGWLDRTVSLMKVDVEGFEPYVFEGGKKLLRDGRVENVFMESSVSDIAKGKFPTQYLYLFVKVDRSSRLILSFYSRGDG